jgi:hypothetical protein
MNEETTKLIQILSSRLGKDTDHIWNILLHSARVDGAVTLFQIICIAAGGFYLYKLHKTFLEKGYKDHQEVIMLISAFLFVIFAIISFLSIEDLINGLFFPQNWALDRLLVVIN